jgi:hypothetical protein
MFFEQFVAWYKKKVLLQYDIAERAGIRLFFTSHTFFNTSRPALGPTQCPKAAEV